MANKFRRHKWSLLIAFVMVAAFAAFWRPHSLSQQYRSIHPGMRKANVASLMGSRPNGPPNWQIWGPMVEEDLEGVAKSPTPSDDCWSNNAAVVHVQYDSSGAVTYKSLDVQLPPMAEWAYRLRYWLFDIEPPPRCYD
jgi:hypothetical protein